jgi:hypothetical protein
MPQNLEEFEFPDEIEAKKAAAAVEQDSESDDDFEIEIENDTPPQDRNRKSVDPEVVEALEDENLEKFNNDQNAALKEAKKVYHQERREKEAAVREQQEAIRLAQKMLDENKKLKERLSNGETVYVDTVKSAALAELESAKQDFKSAYESGDADKLLEAQERMTNAKFKVDKAENYQPQFQKASQEEESVVQSRHTQVNAPDPKAIAWQKQNDWFGSDEEMTSLALGLHEKLVRSGVPAGSDEYYKRIDNTMRKRFPENFEGEQEVDAEEPAKVNKPKASTVVAPATRSTSPKKIRISKTQVALAKKLGLTPEQYARELTKLEAQNG